MAIIVKKGELAKINKGMSQKAWLKDVLIQ